MGIAGCGGVGGIHSQTMARLGIESFHLADFGVETFDRQVGAMMSTVGKSKMDVMNKGIGIRKITSIRLKNQTKAIIYMDAV